MKRVYLGRTAAFLHEPTTAPSGLGVVFVPPFGWDDQSAYRPRRAWANTLAADGHTALRLDLPGTGDAAGGPEDDDLVGTWTAAVSDAVAWLAATRTAVVAMGLGGLIALGALDGVAELILWGVPGRGRGFLREFRAFGRLEAAQTGEDPADVPDGEYHAGGHSITGATAAAITALDAAALIGDRGPERALVLGRDGVEPDAKLVEALKAGGTEVETCAGDGWGAALAGPQYAEVPWSTIERARGWLTAPPRVAAVDTPAPAVGALSLPGAVETTLALPGGRIGVLTEPTDGAPTLTALLLNAGAIRHIGPNRMWVEAARRWADRGVATLRLDLEAIGDATGSDDPYRDNAAFYTPALTAQVASVLDVLAERGLPERFLLAGLCSGGYWAAHTAAEDARVRGVVLLNPQLLVWDADAGSRREFRRALSVFTPEGFRALLRAERPVRRLLTVLGWVLRAPLRRLRREPAPARTDAFEALVTAMRNRGQRLDFAFSGNEPLHDELERSGKLDWVRGQGAGVHKLPYHSHTLKPLAAQRAAHALLDEALRRAQ